MILVVALFVYLLSGLVVLGLLSRRDESLWPDPDISGIIDVAIWPIVVVTWLLLRQKGPPTAAVPSTGPHEPILPTGTTGVATTDLRPWGYVEVDGQRLEARAQHGAISAGCRVEVIGRDGRGVIVRPVNC